MLLWIWFECVAWAMLPIASMSYEVEVVGPLAMVEIRQVYENRGDAPVEAVYVFPMEADAALEHMSLRVGDRVIQGLIKEKHKAVREYDAALQAGKTAALITQERPNIFTQHVGNIQPGERVEVVVRAVQPVPHEDGAYTLTLPLVVMPRFVRPEQLASQLDRIEAQRADESLLTLDPSGLTASMNVHIETVLPIASIDSPSHYIAPRVRGARTRIVQTRVRMNGDFVLRWRVDLERPTASAMMQSGHLLLSLEPPQLPARRSVLPRELVWVIDQSCSMTGEPMALVKDAMRAAMIHADARDSVRILRFNSKIQGDPVSRPLTQAVKHEAFSQIEALEASGGTYLLEGVLDALNAPADPHRERYVMFLTDGAVANERQVLKAIQANVGDARVFAFGVGGHANRWLLNEMSWQGGGRTTWIRAGEDADQTLRRFVDTIDRPVLTDIEIDWGDWVVQEVTQRRREALYVGQPMWVTARIAKRGTGPIVVRGRIGDGDFEQVVEVGDFEHGRAIPVTWARQRIASLERDVTEQFSDAVVDEIVLTSLTYQILSRYTAFVAVDEQEPAVGQILEREVLSRIPMGRSYQSCEIQVVKQQVVSHEWAATAQQSMVRQVRRSKEDLYLLDGANITDPVTGTFSVNFNFDAVDQVEVLLAGFSPEFAGIGPVVNLSGRSGNNNLEYEFGDVVLLSGAGQVSANRAFGSLSGPIVRDKLWLTASTGTQSSQINERTWDGHDISAKLTAQPTAEHRLSLSGSANPWTMSSPRLDLRQESDRALARWQYFPSPDVESDLVVAVSRTDLSGDLSVREQVRERFKLVSLKDGLGGKHTLGLGAGVERLRWQNRGPVSRLVLGEQHFDEARADRFGAFVQDEYQPVSHVFFRLGSRVDQALGGTHWGPRFGVSWDPWGDQRTKIAGAVGQYWGLVDAVAVAAGRLRRKREFLGQLEREFVNDAKIYSHLAYAETTGIPTLDGQLTSRKELLLSVGLQKIQARRWRASVNWDWLKPQGPVVNNRIDDGASARFAHHGSTSLSWDLPTDPWTQRITLFSDAYAQPIGTSTPLGDLNRVRWSGGLRATQNIDIRKGALIVGGSAEHVADVADQRFLDPVMQSSLAVPLLPGLQGFRASFEATYEF